MNPALADCSPNSSLTASVIRNVLSALSNSNYEAALESVEGSPAVGSSLVNASRSESLALGMCPADAGPGLRTSCRRSMASSPRPARANTWCGGPRFTGAVWSGAVACPCVVTCHRCRAFPQEDSYHVQEQLGSPSLGETQGSTLQDPQQATDDSGTLLTGAGAKIACMQACRTPCKPCMEACDHCCYLPPGCTEDLAFFSVFDGHGGDEVAQVRQHQRPCVHHDCMCRLLLDCVMAHGVRFPAETILRPSHL